MKKVIRIFLIVIISLIVMILVRNVITSNMPLLSENYYIGIQYEKPLEQKYSQKGEYEVSHTEYDVKPYTIRVYYPSKLTETDRKYPMIIIVNGSNSPAKKYLPFFERLASWGFIVVGTDDPQTGSGQTTSSTLDYLIRQSDIKQYIDLENIGIAGYSQGGAGALAAVTMYENGDLYKTVFTGSAAYPSLASNMGWSYDYSKISIPYFMTAATGSSDDTGVEDIDKEFGGVAPLQSLKEIYNGMSNDVFKIYARINHAEHEDMLIRSESYLTAWMLFQLTQDKEAAKVFIGEDAEILSNPNWVDIEKNQ